MTHPEHYAVGMLFLAMVAVGGLSALTLSVVAGLKSYRFLLLRRSRSTFWVGMVVTSAFALAVILVAGESMRALVVIASFGPDAYDEGLRVVNKHGQLSDGRYLGVFWAAAWGGGTVVLMMFSAIPAAVWYGHFNPSRNPQNGVNPAGVVRLDGRPLARALVTFHLLVGQKLHGFLAVETDDGGRYAIRDLPLRSFRITVAIEGGSLAPEYGDPARTPLAFVRDRLGPVGLDLDVRSSPVTPAVS